MTQNTTSATSQHDLRNKWLISLLCAGLAAIVSLLFFKAFASLSPLWIVIAIAPLGLAMVYIYPHICTLLCVFLIYSNIPVVAAQFHGSPYAGVIAVPFLLLLPIAWFVWVRREGVVFSWDAALVIGLILVQAIGIIVSRDPQASFEVFVRSLGEGLGLFLLVLNAVRTPLILRGCLWALLATGMFMGAITGHQFVTGSFHSNYGGFAQSDELGFSETNARGVSIVRARSSGPVGEKNRFAQNMLMLLPIGIALAWIEKAWWARLLAIIATGLTAIGWGVSFSRGSIVGMAGTIVIAVFLGYIKPRYLVGLVLAALAIVVIMPQYRERVASLLSVAQLVSKSGPSADTDGSLTGRATIMLAAARVMADHPVVGVGPGMFPYYSRKYGQAGGFAVLEGRWQAHNLYLGVGADNGVLGLGFFLAAIGYVLVRLHRLRKQSLERFPVYATIATAFVIVLLIYLTTGMFLHFSYIRYFWLIFGLAAAACHIIARETSPDRQSDTLAAA